MEYKVKLTLMSAFLIVIAIIVGLVFVQYGILLAVLALFGIKIVEVD